LVPADGILLDVIGTFSRIENNKEVQYPEWHANLRSLIELTEEQEEALTNMSVTPSVPMRVWA
jgi:methionine salvage enolase-phosphatase E1